MIKETLIRARELVSTPEHWTKGSQAIDTDGSAIAWNEDKATCFCMMGAINRAAWELNSDGAYDAMDHIETITCTPLPRFNDNRYTTHEDVLKAFDQAIAKCST